MPFYDYRLRARTHSLTDTHTHTNRDKRILRESGGGGGKEDMDGVEGWRVKACSSSVKDKTIINPIMLRFRPIAPKPVTGDSSYGNWKPESRNGLVNKERKKRKYVRVKKKNGNEQTRKKKMIPISSDQERETEDHGVKETLQLIPDEKITDLIPEKGSLSDGVVRLSLPVVQHEKDQDLLLDINNQYLIDDMGGLRMSDPITPKRLVETRVTVESVTDTCMDMVLQGSTDVERMRNLDKDSCPVFISVGLNRVQWVNEAYKKMVKTRQEVEGQSPEISVDLVIKDNFLAHLYRSAFTCWVRLQYTWEKEKCSHGQMVPCDVWKMEFGGFAWRLDVKAALSLGLN